MAKRNKTLGWISFVFICLSWGSIYLIVANLLDHFNPIVISFLRSFLAFVVIAVHNGFYYFKTRAESKAFAAQGDMTDYARLPPRCARVQCFVCWKVLLVQRHVYLVSPELPKISSMDNLANQTQTGSFASFVQLLMVRCTVRVGGVP